MFRFITDDQEENKHFGKLLTHGGLVYKAASILVGHRIYLNEIGILPKVLQSVLIRSCLSN